MKKKVTREKKKLGAKTKVTSKTRLSVGKITRVKPPFSKHSLSKDHFLTKKIDLNQVMSPGPSSKVSRHRQRQLYYGFSIFAGAFALFAIGHFSLQKPSSHSIEKIQSISNDRNVFHSAGPLAFEFSEVSLMSFPERIDYWSHYLEESFQGREKVEALVSEVTIQDIAPLVPKKYNCTTFVETVIALARSNLHEEFVKNLIAVRYRDGQANFSHRNHFPEADWIPNNQKADIITDITEWVAEASHSIVMTENKQIKRGKWLAQQIARAHLDRQTASVDTKNLEDSVLVHLPYIPVSEFGKVAKSIPTGTIVNLVHQNDSNHPVLIAHQGFLIQKGGELWIRHASTGGRIRTTFFSEYLKKIEGIDTHWPLIGINLNQVNEKENPSSFQE